MLKAACTLLKTSTYVPNRLNYVTKHNLKKQPRIFKFHKTRNFLTTPSMRAICFSETSASTYLSVLMIQGITERK
jgi:hypothetical protein